MNWAWKQQVAPTVKLVLMSLADAADDHGVCWPSLPTVARKCNISPRTVRRMVRELVAGGLLRCEPRFRHDGSSSSNRYTLALEGGDKLSGAPVTTVRTPGPGCREGEDSHDCPRTTSEPSIESPQPPLVPSLTVVPVTAPPANVAGDHDHGGSGDRGDDHHDDRRLEYPPGLSETERAAARQKLRSLPADLAQQLLDELAGRMRAGSIRVSPLAYLRGLVTRAGAGNFTPEVALQIADNRQRRRRNKAVLRHAEATRMNALRKEASVALHAGDSPLVRRLAAIRNRSPCGSGEGE